MTTRLPRIWINCEVVAQRFLRWPISSFLDMALCLRLMRRPHNDASQEQVAPHGHVIDEKLLTQSCQRQRRRERPAVTVEPGSLTHLVRGQADRPQLDAMAEQHGRVGVAV